MHISTSIYNSTLCIIASTFHSFSSHYHVNLSNGFFELENRYVYKRHTEEKLAGFLSKNFDICRNAQKAQEKFVKKAK